MQANLIHTDDVFESGSVIVANKIAKSLFHASTANVRETRKNYLNHVEEVLKRNGDLPQLVAGDFNIDLMLDELVLRKNLENIMPAHCLNLISMREATRETETSSSYIDGNFGKVPLLNSTIEKTSFFDHYSLHSKLDLEYEALESIYRFRCLKKLENRDYSEKFSFYLAHTLGKIEETGQSGEVYITKSNS